MIKALLKSILFLIITTIIIFVITEILIKINENFNLLLYPTTILGLVATILPIWKQMVKDIINE